MHGVASSTHCGRKPSRQVPSEKTTSIVLYDFCSSAAAAVAIGQLKLQLSHYSLVTLHCRLFASRNVTSEGASRGPRKKFSRLAIARHIFRPPHKLCYNSTTGSQQVSPTQSVRFGVPQGSVLGPLLFVLYTADLNRVVASHGLVLHQYTDDCQIYISTPVDDAAAAVDRFPVCLDDLEAWLSSSRLRLNPAKMHVLWLGSKYQLLKLSIQDLPVLSASIKIVDTARDLRHGHGLG